MKKVYVYSIGKFNELSEKEKENFAIIRIHNIKNQIWYENEDESENSKWFFFEDTLIEQLSFIEKIKVFYTSLNHDYFSRKIAREMLAFIFKNKGKNFIIHCEFGRSRSVAVACFLKECLNYNIANKTEKELKKANTLVLKLLKEELKKHKNEY